MNVVPRPPPLILFIQNHASVENQFDYLTLAGLRVAQTPDDGNMLATVLRLIPDLIVLNFNGDGDTAERLKPTVPPCTFHSSRWPNCPPSIVIPGYCLTE